MGTAKSATWTLGFDTIETPEQAEAAHSYALRIIETLADDVRRADGISLVSAKEHARELHRLLVAIERYWR